MKKRHPVPVPGRKKKKKKDFSDGVVVTMLLLLVVVSIISIAFYLHALNTIKPKFVVNEGKAIGEVSITITKAPSESASGETVSGESASGESELAAVPKENNLNSQP